MKLTEIQIEEINRELAELERLIAAEPTKGLFRFVVRQEALWLIVRLHNLQIRQEKKEAEEIVAKIEKGEEIVARIEKGKENLRFGRNIKDT